jgi:hypothetical protein
MTNDPRIVPTALTRKEYRVAQIASCALLALSLASMVVSYLWWDRLSWGWRVIVAAVPVILASSPRDMLRVFMSYSRYLREYDEPRERRL